MKSGLALPLTITDDRMSISSPRGLSLLGEHSVPGDGSDSGTVYNAGFSHYADAWYAQ